MSGRVTLIVYLLCLLIAIGALIAEIAGGGAVHKLVSSPGPKCPLSDPGSNLGYTLEGCRLVRSDTAADPNAHHLWGARYACASDNRVSNPRTGGDREPTAVGAPQGNTAYRQLTVLDGDNYSGERCELGYNTWNEGLASASNPYGTFYNYFEDARRATYFSVKLPDNFPLGAAGWQGVGQMKQSGGSNGSGGTPVLSFSAYKGAWSFWHTYPNNLNQDFELWRIPARKDVWTRMAIDAYYSQHVDRGWIRYYVDANGDGDFSDPGEQSPIFHLNTLKAEIPGTTADGLAAGDTIPSHLRLGLYHRASIPCPPPSGCSLDIDNVQVLEP